MFVSFLVLLVLIGCYAAWALTHESRQSILPFSLSAAVEGNSRFNSGFKKPVLYVLICSGNYVHILV